MHTPPAPQSWQSGQELTQAPPWQHLPACWQLTHVPAESVPRAMQVWFATVTQVPFMQH